jgi:pyruvate/2-oxoglutarate/acetoin dehydrogenase E1 component
VGKLSLTEAVDLQFVLAVEEASRVELTEDVLAAGEAVRESGGTFHLGRDLALHLFRWERLE